jgi:3-phenylpropionate/cinnamic acid dioxygenase small subunit
MSDAHEEIRALIGRYCELMDAGEFDDLADLFADARLSDEHGTVFAQGAGEVAKMWHSQTILYDGSPRTRHLTADPIIDVDEPAGVANARSSYVVFQATDGLSLQPIITGRYIDRFVRRDGTPWRWDERRYAVDQLGDLSYHLRRPPNG